MFKSYNIYLKLERFSQIKVYIITICFLPFDFDFDNVNFDLRKRSDFK